MQLVCWYGRPLSYVAVDVQDGIDLFVRSETANTVVLDKKTALSRAFTAARTCNFFVVYVAKFFVSIRVEVLLPCRCARPL